eukprot:GHVL01017227.1.p2 GENE.GHVL01017227.1~~GHVL01017227.1.p2  ORF type:complete len:262 (+),score=68.51 GHVL01017227.1:42-827(+)
MENYESQIDLKNGDSTIESDLENNMSVVAARLRAAELRLHETFNAFHFSNVVGNSDEESENDAMAAYSLDADGSLQYRDEVKDDDEESIIHIDSNNFINWGNEGIFESDSPKRAGTLEELNAKYSTLAVRCVTGTEDPVGSDEDVGSEGSFEISPGSTGRGEGDVAGGRNVSGKTLKHKTKTFFSKLIKPSKSEESQFGGEKTAKQRVSVKRKLAPYRVGAKVGLKPFKELSNIYLVGEIVSQEKAVFSLGFSYDGRESII